MNFSSYLFLLGFLPISVLIYYMISFSSLHTLRLPALCIMTMAFYASAASRYLPLLLGSIAFNYVCSVGIVHTVGRWRFSTLILGVSANAGALIYFKYSESFLVFGYGLFGISRPITHLVLPLAISFFTFQQIAFLVDTFRGEASVKQPVAYVSSILFFPYVVSGPITFFREVSRQLAVRPVPQDVPGNMLIGLVLLTLGLFKKTVIADSYALWVNPLYEASSAGKTLGMGGSWAMSIAFLLQVYFDFSGYSDMAIGTARMLGIVLPLNFHAPLRSTSIIDYWRRWHVTLGRFVNLYIFLPIAVPLSRFSANRGFGRKGMLVVGSLVPTFLTMIIIGAWHGGSWNFVVFGALHGSYMVINEVWRSVTRKRRKGRQSSSLGRAVGNLLTNAAVVFAMVAFRAPDLITAGRVWREMLGVSCLDCLKLAEWPVLAPLGLGGLIVAMVPGFMIVYLLPTSQQFVSRYVPVLEWSKWRYVSLPAIAIEWRPWPIWAALIGIILLTGAAFVARGSTNFVYFGF